MDSIPAKWDLEVDVAAVGTGAAGMMAALQAHDGGAEVAILEAADKIGGTTCRGVGFACPNNHYMAEKGLKDSREEALTYLKHFITDEEEGAMAGIWLDTVNEMMLYLEKQGRIRMHAPMMPDYHAELPGGKLGGRSVAVGEFDAKQLGEWIDKLRFGYATEIPVDVEDATEKQGWIKPQNIDWMKAMERKAQGIVTLGPALIGSMLKAALDRSMKPLLKTRARHLIMSQGRIIGLQAEREGKYFYIRTRKAVILATGGFDCNEKLKAAFLPGPPTKSCTPPSIQGDGLMMAMEVGAQLDNMCEAWWTPTLMIPGEEADGAPLGRMCLVERTAPHSIMVNRYGRRFVNEACNYNDGGKSFLIFDPVKFEFPNQPAWIVLDGFYRTHYPIITVMPGDPDPEWLARGNTLEDLATKVGIDPKGLKETVERFNLYAARGEDPEFHRGEFPYDRGSYGDFDYKPVSCLGPLDTPPFYAVPVYHGTIGTKGGPKVNTKGQVLNVEGNVIPGLYAAGNAMGIKTFRRSYPFAGSTISNALVWGYIAGKNAAKGPSLNS